MPHDESIKRVHLTFPADRIKEPIIYRLATEYNLVTNIRRAEIAEDFGWVMLEMTGDHADMDRGIAYLEELGVEVDPIEQDVVEG